jgi:hypothetical protein
MNAQRTKQLTTGCAHSNGKPGVPASTTNISVRFAADLIIRFRIEKTVKTAVSDRSADLAPRPVALRRFATVINEP